MGFGGLGLWSQISLIRFVGMWVILCLIPRGGGGGGEGAVEVGEEGYVKNTPPMLLA